jgi:hypothetical protein
VAVLTAEESPLRELDAEESPERDARPTALLCAALASAAAGAIHFAFAPGHMDESITHGLFFAGVGLYQIGWALAVVIRPAPLVVRLGWLNAGVIAVWVASRTSGVPFSEAEGAEAVGFADVAATAFEVLIVAVTVAIGVRWRPLARPRLGVIGLAAALVAAGVTVAAISPATGGTEHLHAAGDEAALTGETPCEQSGAPASPAQVTDTEGHFHRGPVEQVALDSASRQLLAEQQALARTVVDRLPTVAAAEAGGYHKSTPYVPCIGAHYTNPMLVARFDPAAPSELLFDGTEPESKLVGLSYLVYHPGGVPEGFAGPNDLWHEHNSNGGLCFKDGIVVGGEEVSQAQCAEVGGQKRTLPDIWMLHDWVVPGWECSWGVFAPECPELGGRVGGSAWDTPAPGEAPPGVLITPGTGS